MFSKGRDKTSRLPRRALVTGSEELTATGTLRISFQVIDDEPFDFAPGQFVAIDFDHPGLGYRRSPYCILNSPTSERRFELLVRVIPQGPVSVFLGDLEPGDVISFRGPTGLSMIPKESRTELILIATGVGVGPFYGLADHLLSRGFSRSIRLYWGLRLLEDICLVEELKALTQKYPNFTYQISLSQPPSTWRGLRGRVTESVPPLLKTLGNKHFYLCGNGAMIAELSRVLSDLGVRGSLIYEESYFNHHHKPDESTLDELRGRFVAKDLFSPFEHIREVLSQG